MFRSVGFYPDEELDYVRKTIRTAVLVVHTFEQLTHDRGRIRLISARRPTKVEIHEYEEQRLKPEYDFSKGKRGKSFRPNVEIRLPIYLDSDIQSYLAERAAQKGIPLGEMVSGLLKREIQIVESVK